MALLVLIRRPGLRAALNGPPWLLPDPLLSETLLRAPIPAEIPRRPGPARDYARSFFALGRAALGRARIPRSVRLAWP